MRRFLIALGIAAIGIAGCRDTYDSAVPVAPLQSQRMPKSFDGIVYQQADNGIYAMDDDGSNVRTIVAPTSAKVRELRGVGQDRLVYYEAPPGRDAIAFYAIDLDGEDRVLLRESTIDSTAVPFLDFACAISSDGTTAVYCTKGLGSSDAGGPDASGQRYLHIVDTRNPGATHPTIAVNIKQCMYPAFSPDGTRISFFGITPGNQWALMVINADGTGLRTIADPAEASSKIVWTPDGSSVSMAPFGSPGRIVTYSVATGSATTLTLSGRQIDGFSYSPDGTRITYVQEESGPYFQRNVWITDLSGTAAAVTSGLAPRYSFTKWSADGNTLLVQAYTSGGTNNDQIGILTIATGNVSWIGENVRWAEWIP